LQAYSETSGIITMFYVVRGLSPYTEYEFHVIGVNNIGRGPASAAVSTTTGETGSKSRILENLRRTAKPSKFSDAT
jgi:receptor-type tyrosine-protein phosphatase delta